MARYFVTTLIVFSLAASGALAGPLSPPAGTIAPTEAIEPRVCLNDLSDDEGASVLITTPGQYYLRRDIVGETGNHGIRFTTAGDVSIDLNGFVVRGVPGSLNGIDMDLGSQTLAGSRFSIRCLDGTCRAPIIDWGGDDVHTNGVIDCSFTHLIVEDCGGAVLRHLHSEGVAHRDIATRNCLSDGTVTTPPTQARAGRGVTHRFAKRRTYGNTGIGINLGMAFSNEHVEGCSSTSDGGGRHLGARHGHSCDFV